MLPRVGAVPVAALTTGDVQRLVDEIAADRTAEHARKALTALRVALRVCGSGTASSTRTRATACASPSTAEGEQPPRVLTPEEAERDHRRRLRSTT